MKAKVVITDWGFKSLNVEQEIFSSHNIELTAHQCRNEDEVAQVAADADVVMAQWAPVKKKAIGAMQHCRGIVRYGIGLDNIDLEAAKEKGIPVRNVPDYCLDEVADHTMALILALQRQVCRVFDLVRNGTWRITPPLELPPLRKSTLGIIGFGRIARLLAQRALPFGLRIIASDPFGDEETFRNAGVRKVPIDKLFEVSDILSLHCPLTNETRHIVNATTLGRMKRTSLLVNTSRGDLVDSPALQHALKENLIAGAAVDVLDREPIPQDHPLLKLSNFIATSHISWYSSESVGELQRRAALTALDLLGLRQS
ncbi:MAG: C-terminal binding protein [Ignavibacteriales bacterium]|nr:C-terminal binding protein [Ignavibacteriales bacterium]